MKAITLMYHDVVAHDDWDASGFPGADAARYKLDHDSFNDHLRAIADATSVAPTTILELSRAAQAQTPLLLTFDDGGASACALIADMLEARGWRGHFFVATDYVDTPTFLSRAQLRELHARGHVVGSHSSSHPVRMSRCTWDELLREWRASLALLADTLGARVAVASVPGGYYSQRVAAAAAEAGIETLFTSEPTTTSRTVAGCQVFGRYAIQRGTTARTAAQLAAGRLAPRLQQQFVWQAKKVTKALGGSYYLKLRRALIEHG
jgi:peptidoglycan/xylan/chitin deacetylase (PgdA/CDA1 family)